MNTESLFGVSCARAARIFAAVLDAGPTGTILSIDVGGSFFDRLAWGAAIAFGCEFSSFPSLLRHRSRLWDYKYPIKPVDVAREPILFGRCDGWMQSFDEAGLSRSYALDFGKVAVRSIDAWTATRSPIRAIHFGDAQLITDHIRSAEATLIRERPLVTLYPPTDASSAAEVLSLLEGMGFRVFDLGGQPVTRATGSSSTDLGWIALVRDMWDALPADIFSGADATAQSPWAGEQTEILGVPLRQRRSGEIFGLGRIAPPQLARTVSAAEVVCMNDCYPVETDGKSSWRWLGPQARSRIGIPCVFPGTYRFDISVISCRTPGGIAGCRVLVGGREVVTAVEGEERGKLSFVGRLDAAGYAGYTEIDFVNRGAPPPAGSDSRTLRINLGAIEIAPCH
ncbi:MAG TPA: hypothetical protein VGK90_11770 [Rhizomicrobium sp.]|jgi:hypothetical protein